MHPHRPAILSAALAAALATSGCLTTRSFMGGTLYLGGIGGPVTYDASSAIDTVSYWDGEGVGGTPSVRIKLDEQKAYFYKGGALVGVSMISSGREGFGTPRGRFKIIQKEVDHRSTLYGEIYDGDGNLVNKDADITKDRIPPGGRFLGAPMPFFMRINKGIGMHTGFLPGYAASHGCIRMPDQMARHFFSNVAVGTPVAVE